MRETVGIPGTGLGWYQTQRLTLGSHFLLWIIIVTVVAFLLFGR